MMLRTIQISKILLITAAAYLCVNGIYQIIESKLNYSSVLQNSVRPAATNELKTKQPIKSDYDAIINRNLFKTEKQSENISTLSKADIDTLKQTDLKLKLWGTVSTDRKKTDYAWAVIEDTSSGQQALYRVGDKIKKATITEIFRNSVILDVNGRSEKLITEDEKIADKEKKDFQEKVITAQESGRAVSIKHTQVDEAFNNINDFLKQVRIEPVFKDGKPDGVMLSNIESTSILKKMGLRIGDIITGINGQKIDSLDNALSFYENLSTGEKVSLQLKRRGRPTSMDIVIE